MPRTHLVSSIVPSSVLISREEVARWDKRPGQQVEIRLCLRNRMSLPKYKTLKLDLSTSGVLTIMFSGPVGNAMSPRLFEEWLAALRYAEAEEAVRVLVQTGDGRYYSSGKDLTSTMHDSFEQEVNREIVVLEDLIDALINFSKPSIAAVNGPAIGLSVTTLALFDFVYAVPEATFSIPFMRWGFCAEGCSSALFPRMLGKHIADDLLLAGSTLPASKLAGVGFLEILNREGFTDTIAKKARVLANYDPAVVLVTKNLVNQGQRQELMAVNHRELATLKELMMKDNSRRTIQEFVDQRAAKQTAKKKQSAKL